MNAPRPLSDADLLAWAVVLEHRRQQQKDGVKTLLFPYPPCPACGQPVHKADAWWVREPIRGDVKIMIEPCGHSHRATFSDVERIHPHLAAMLEGLERKLPTPDELAAEARRRVGEPEPEAVEAETPDELTVEEARSLVDDLGLDLYRAQDALAFVGECCDIADREQRAITTADVREWLKGARCGRRLPADGPACSCGGRYPTRHLHADVHEPVEQSPRTTPNNPATSSDTAGNSPRADAEAWRRKAIRRALKISKLQGTIQAVTDLASEKITARTEWGDGYRAALADLQEALREFGHLPAAPDAAATRATKTQESQ